MKSMSTRFTAVTLLGTIVVALMLAVRAVGDEPDQPAAVVAIELLVPESQLDQVYLSIVDDKLALSLAVEAHIQVEFTRFALSTIQDQSLQSLTENKLRVYRQLFNTLDDLTGGRASSMMARPSETNQPAAQTAAAGTADDEERRPARRKKRGGLSSVLQSAATKAILKVRLDIAGQYADLLRAELATLPPGEFDRCYIRIEVYNQMQVLAMLRVFEQRASDDFARVIHVATSAVEAQVGEARTIAGRLNNSLPLPAATETLVNTADTSGM